MADDEKKVDDKMYDYQSRIIPPSKSLKAGIAWDFTDKPIDLDISVIAIDVYGFEQDAAFFNKTEILEGAIIHSGDNKTGIGGGDDETVTFDFEKLPDSIFALVFLANCHSGGSLNDVKDATFSLYGGDDNSKTFHKIKFKHLGNENKNTASLIGALYKKEAYSMEKFKDWKFMIFDGEETLGFGKNFDDKESRKLIELGLRHIFPKYILDERPKDRKIKYDLCKGDMYVFDESIKKVTVGLGWDPAGSGSVDCDASILIYNKDLGYMNCVYFSNLSYDYGSIKHHGDNLTGAGGGDDERIDIHLDKINNDVSIMAVAITIYSGSSTFKNIKNCYARMVDENNEELCRFNLSETADGNGLIMVSLQKKKNKLWGMKCIGAPAKGNTAPSLKDECSKILKGDGFEHIHHDH